MRYAPAYRPSNRLFTLIAARRSALARAVREANGIFRERVKPSGRRYRRYPKHRQRAVAELMLH